MCFHACTSCIPTCSTHTICIYNLAYCESHVHSLLLTYDLCTEQSNNTNDRWMKSVSVSLLRTARFTTAWSGVCNRCKFGTMIHKQHTYLDHLGWRDETRGRECYSSDQFGSPSPGWECSGQTHTNIWHQRARREVDL